jgi:hypothetical protein
VINVSMMYRYVDRTPQAWDMLTIPFSGPSHMRGPENEMHEHDAFINNKHIAAYSALLREKYSGYPAFSLLSDHRCRHDHSFKALETFYTCKCLKL